MSMSTKDSKLFEKFLDIKERFGLEIVDTHVHPVDVMGIVDENSHNKNENVIDMSPSVLELYGYSGIIINVLKLVSRCYPTIIRKSIVKIFKKTNEKQLLHEMESAGVDKSVLLPVEPRSNIKKIRDTYTSNKFISLGSVDVNGIDNKDIEKYLSHQMARNNIRGIKLHPNIQRFYPCPSMNDNDVAEKLRKIYKFAGDNGLYILFHAGISLVFDIDKKETVVEYAKFENFFDNNGISEIFEKYRMPIILAHMGCYNVVNPDIDLIAEAANRYKNLYFDTAGVNRHIISKILDKVGEDRVVFGTDAFYFNIKFNLLSVLKALNHSKKSINFEQKVAKIFSTNYTDNILKSNI